MIPHFLVHILERLVPQDTSVGNKDVYRAKSINGGLDDGITIFGGTSCSDSFSASCTLDTGRCTTRVKLTSLDLIDDLGCILLAYIVDDNVGAKLSEHEGVASAKTGTSSSDDDSLSLELDLLGTLRVGRHLL